MRRLFLISSLTAIGLIGIPATASAQQSAPPAQAANARDPITMAALNRMGAALRKLEKISAHVDITAEDVLISDQKLQYGGTAQILADRPAKLRMMLAVGQGQRQLYYDGKKVTLYAPQQNVYGVFPAPPTIHEMLKVAADKYDLEIPLADMFTWGQDPGLEARVIEAFPVGEENIGGQACEHHAVRQDLVDWQIWIRKGENALPCKLVITNTADPAMPQYTAVYRWDPAPTIDPAAFAFKAPQGANQIVFGPMLGSTEAARK